MKLLSITLIFIVLIFAGFKAQALSSYSQCSLDERPFLLEYSWKDESSKSIFEIKINEKIIKHDQRNMLHLKNNIDFGIVSDRGSKYEEFYQEEEKYFLKSFKKLSSREMCWPKYTEDKDLNPRERKRFSHVSLNCHSYKSQNGYIMSLSDNLFYNKSDVKNIKKQILESDKKSTLLKQSHKFSYYLGGEVHHAQILATAKINPEHLKSYKCSKDSEILVCGENCLKYSRKNLHPNLFVSDPFRLNLRGEKAQYLLEFDFSTYSSLAGETLNEEELEKTLLKKLEEKKESKPLSLKDLYLISNTLTRGKPFEVHSLRAVKYN